jgi:glycosyltransferase involved in cell wall biosynthesis
MGPVGADTPLVSVVVPVFNGQDSIAACLDTLLALNFPRDLLEIIVVDNASTDKTADVLAAFRGKVRLLIETTRGAAAARNRGIQEATGRIIAFTDADCTVDRDWVRHLIEPLKDSTVGIAGGRILAAKPCNAIEKFGETIHDHQKAIEVFKPPYAISMNWSSPRQVLIEAGLFDESYLRCQDVDLSQRIFRRGYKIVYCREAIIFHRNERTFAGLFREGYQHGMWAVKHHMRHYAISGDTDRRRLDLRGYRAIGANLRDAIISGQRMNALCQATFDIGKKCGRAVGSIRFGFIDL